MEAAEFRETFANLIVAKENWLSIREWLAERLAEGVSREWLIEELTGIMLTFRANDDEESEDLVGDALDLLTGWCAPQYRL